MKKFKYFVFAGLAVSASLATAQVPAGYFDQALLFSQSSFTYGSTARMQAIGGTQISLGADMSSAASNPAGLGFFNRSVFSMTPGMNFNTSSSAYLGDRFNSFRNNFNIPNIGIVLNANKGNYTEEKFKAGSFAITYNRINNFNSTLQYRGRNGISVIDQMIAEAGTTVPEALPEYPYAAFENYLIDPEYDTSDQLIGYSSVVLGNPLQSEYIRTSGGQGQLNFAWGGNYDDRIYFGGGIGITTVRYQVERSYTEEQFLYQDSVGNDQFDDLIQFTEYNDEYTVSGGGVNATLGVIFRPVDFITIGASYITPTYYSLEDENGFTQVTNWNNLPLGGGETTNQEDYSSDIIINQFNLRSPGRINLGASAFLGKLGFISGDVQFVDYTTSQLRSNDFNETGDNQVIGELYRDVINYRLGAEFRLDDFRLRAGYAYYGDPYNDGSNYDESRQNFSGGFGYRGRDYFIDLAVVRSQKNRLFGTYFPTVQGDFVDTENITTTVSATIGFNF